MSKQDTIANIVFTLIGDLWANDALPDHIKESLWQRIRDLEKELDR